jgi:hypothetical protein
MYIKNKWNDVTFNCVRLLMLSTSSRDSEEYIVGQCKSPVQLQSGTIWLGSQ